MSFEKGQSAICEECKIEFPMEVAHQRFCCRRCFRRSNYKKTSKLDPNKIYPSFICSNCGKKTELDFKVLNGSAKWEDFKCPKCGVANQSTMDSAEFLEDVFKGEDRA